MSRNNIKNIINDNDLTIDINTEKGQKNTKSSLKNISIKKDNNNKDKELNVESRNNTLESKKYLSNNLPSIINPLKTENNEDNINLNQNYFYSESNTNEKNQNEKEIKKIRIIDERQKNVIEYIKKRHPYKIIFIYKNEDYYISIKPNCKISDIKEIIAKEINLDKDKIILIYKDKEMDEANRNIPVNKFINFAKLKSRPIIYVKKKYVNNIKAVNNLDIYKYSSLNYENKIKIINYPTMSNSNLSDDEDLFNIVSNFCKNNSITSAFFIEKNDDNPDLIYHLISFASSDIVFDFNKYFTSLKLTNPIFKDTKVVMILSKRKNLKNNNSLNTIENPKRKKKSINEVYEDKRKSGEMKRNLLNMNINRFINNYGPYITPYERLKSDEKENKKKWLNPKGFISSVNKYSGIKWYL